MKIKIAIIIICFLQVIGSIFPDILGFSFKNGRLITTKWKLFYGGNDAYSYESFYFSNNCISRGFEKLKNDLSESSRISFLCATRCISVKDGTEPRHCEIAIGVVCENEKCELKQLEKVKGGFY